MNAFVYDNGTNFLDVSNDRVSFAPTSQAWLQGLKFIHGLFVKGLISSEIFTQTGDTVQSEVNDGDVAMVAAHSASDVVANYGVGTVWKDWLGTLPVLRGPKGVEYTRFAGNQPTGETFAITNKATLPQIRAVMKLLNFMYTPDGQQIEDFGPAGIYWTYAKKGQKGLTGQQALFNTDWNKFYGAVEPQNYGWNTMGPMYQSEVWRNGGLALPYNTPDGSQTDLQLEAELHYEGHQPAEVYPGVVWVPPKDAQTYAFDETNIDDYVNEWTADFVTGAKPLSDWTTYVAGLKKLGLSQYLTLSQRYMGKPFNTSAFKPVPAQIKFLESDH
jgi:putative aldouronate transport system substrate-binding protein